VRLSGGSPESSRSSFIGEKVHRVCNANFSDLSFCSGFRLPHAGPTHRGQIPRRNTPATPAFRIRAATPASWTRSATPVLKRLIADQVRWRASTGSADVEARAHLVKTVLALRRLRHSPPFEQLQVHRGAHRPEGQPFSGELFLANPRNRARTENGSRTRRSTGSTERMREWRTAGTGSDCTRHRFRWSHRSRSTRPFPTHRRLLRRRRPFRPIRPAGNRGQRSPGCTPLRTPDYGRCRCHSAAAAGKDRNPLVHSRPEATAARKTVPRRYRKTSARFHRTCRRFRPDHRILRFLPRRRNLRRSRRFRRSRRLPRLRPRTSLPHSCRHWRPCPRTRPARDRGVRGCSPCPGRRVSCNPGLRTRLRPSADAPTRT
jgi:hypothetical protein